MFSLTALFRAVTRTWRHQLGFHGCGTPGPGEAAFGSLDEHCRLQTGVSQCNDSKQEHCGQGEGRRGDEGEMTWISSEWRIHTRGQPEHLTINGKGGSTNYTMEKVAEQAARAMHPCWPGWRLRTRGYLWEQIMAVPWEQN